MTSSPASRPRGRRAATLVEVLAALALLAILLTGVVSTRRHLAHQTFAAQQKRRAVAAADNLLSTWWQNPKTLPRAGAGAVPGESNLVWQTMLVPNATADALKTQIVRLQITDASQTNPAPLTTVELLLDAETPTTQPARRPHRR
jgi:Tfp pilus assembly protein PilV